MREGEKRQTETINIHLDSYEIICMVDIYVSNSMNRFTVASNLVVRFQINRFFHV